MLLSESTEVECQPSRLDACQEKIASASDGARPRLLTFVPQRKSVSPAFPQQTLLQHFGIPISTYAEKYMPVRSMGLSVGNSLS